MLVADVLFKTFLESVLQWKDYGHFTVQLIIVQLYEVYTVLCRRSSHQSSRRRESGVHDAKTPAEILNMRTGSCLGGESNPNRRKSYQRSLSVLVSWSENNK